MCAGTTHLPAALRLAARLALQLGGASRGRVVLADCRRWLEHDVGNCGRQRRVGQRAAVKLQVRVGPQPEEAADVAHLQHGRIAGRWRLGPAWIKTTAKNGGMHHNRGQPAHSLAPHFSDATVVHSHRTPRMPHTTQKWTTHRGIPAVCSLHAAHRL